LYLFAEACFAAQGIRHPEDSPPGDIFLEYWEKLGWTSLEATEGKAADVKLFSFVFPVVINTEELYLCSK